MHHPSLNHLTSWGKKRDFFLFVRSFVHLFLFLRASRGKKRLSQIPQSELQEVVRQLMWVLGTNLQSFRRAANALN